MAHPEWALVLGGGAEVWNDVAAWEAQYGQAWDGLIVAANDIGCYWPRRLEHWVSLHPAKFLGWKTLRASNGHPDGYVTWGRVRNGAAVSDRQLLPWAGGSSGLFAVQVAHEVGCTRAILCGIPMTQTGWFAESREHVHPVWYGATGHWHAWLRELPRLRPWVRSMGGETQRALGAPNRAWLLAEEVGPGT